jgi:hypothetical protein
MSYYDNILNLLSLVLVLFILFIVLFGCQFRKQRQIERFSTSVEKTEDDIKSSNNDDNNNDNNNDDNNKTKSLEGFEGKILNGLNDGSITNKEMETLISNGTFTKKNLENIIEYIEKFRDNIKI